MDKTTDKLQHYNNLKTVPADALKPIQAGRLKGKSDISPQWRIEAMTNEFGVCGIGWKPEIVKTWTQTTSDNQIMVFVELNLYIKDGENWSSPIPGIGGDFLVKKESNGLYSNDEAYKMATTDALGVCMKMLGVAADVYRGFANDSKYGREKPSQFDSKQQNKVTNTNTPAQPKKDSQQAQTSNTVPSANQLIALGKKAEKLNIGADVMPLIINFKFGVGKALTMNNFSDLFNHLEQYHKEYLESQNNGKAS
jgi:hypothetical protein